MKANLSVVVVALLLCFGSLEAVAQDLAADSKVRNKSGDMGLIFDIGGLGTFNVNRGQPFYSISARDFISDNFAVIAGLVFGTASEGTDSTGSKSTSIGVNAGVQKHWPLYGNNTSFYGEFKLRFISGSSTDSLTTQPVDEAKNNQQNPQAVAGTQFKTSESTFGVGVGVGFDWYLFDGIAIGSSFRLNFNSTSSSTETSTGTSDNPSSSSLGIGTEGAVHMIISF